MALRKFAKKLLEAAGYEIRRKTKPPSISSEGERLRSVASHRDVLKLHVGCGPRVLKGWINIDLAYEPYEEYLKYYTDQYYALDMRGGRDEFFALDIPKYGLPLPDESVDVVFHEDFIEHLTQRDQFVFLAETFRALKKGAIHRVNTPDIVASMRKRSKFEKGVSGVYVEEWDKWHHLNVLSRSTLEEMAYLVGYSKVVFGRRNSSSSGLIPPEYRPAGERGDEDNIFADLTK
jgi:predicted SAM-dependent methyltransferase